MQLVLAVLSALLYITVALLVVQLVPITNGPALLINNNV